MRMRAVFITGTDTGVGKTMVAGLLARYLRAQGHQAVTQKWVQTGTCDFPSDLPTHLDLMDVKREAFQAYEADMNPYALELAASPHLAAAHENIRIDTRKIVASFRRLSRRFDTVIVEGAGGILVPLNRKKLFVDLVESLALPVVVVAANKLGAINHTLLTLEALRRRSITVLGVVFNTLDRQQDEIVLRDNPKIVHAFARTPILGQLPWSTDFKRLYHDFEPVAKRIWLEYARTQRSESVDRKGP
ncbi:MAG: dethiobiotin synthase [Phycisphaerales bacterium]|nr:MAG: dethiobiotin synthase [Phycisphaerales bacterium]